MGIAAAHLPRRLLDYHDALGTILLGGNGGSQCGVARADHDDVIRTHNFALLMDQFVVDRSKAAISVAEWVSSFSTASRMRSA